MISKNTKKNVKKQTKYPFKLKNRKSLYPYEPLKEEILPISMDEIPTFSYSPTKQWREFLQSRSYYSSGKLPYFNTLNE